MTFQEKVEFGKRCMAVGRSLRVHGDVGEAVRVAKAVVKDTNAVILHDVTTLALNDFSFQVVFVGDQEVGTPVNNKFIHI